MQPAHLRHCVCGFTGRLLPRRDATWRADAKRGSNTRFSVLDGATPLGTVRVNQEQAPASLTESGIKFGDLGTSWSLTGSTLVVKISDDTVGYADADAIRIERTGD